MLVFASNLFMYCADALASFESILADFSINFKIDIFIEKKMQDWVLCCLL